MRSFIVLRPHTVIYQCLWESHRINRRTKFKSVAEDLEFKSSIYVKINNWQLTSITIEVFFHPFSVSLAPRKKQKLWIENPFWLEPLSLLLRNQYVSIKEKKLMRFWGQLNALLFNWGSQQILSCLPICSVVPKSCLDFVLYFIQLL